jgi:phosphate transport system substrate-binding protein
VKGSSKLADSPQLCSSNATGDIQTQVRTGPLPDPFQGAKRTIVILSLALAGCSNTVAPPTTDIVSLKLLTDNATRPLLHDLSTSYHPNGINLAWDIQVGDARSILDWLKNAEAPYALTDYLPTGIDNSWWITPVGQDGIAIIINPTNPIASLSASQLRSILQGRIDNWKMLGGADVPVTVVARNERSSAAAVIQAVVLGQRQTTRTARLATTNEAVIQIVANDPGAIGYVSMGYLDSSVRTVPLDGIAITPDTVTSRQYAISTPIVFIGLTAPANDAYRAFFAWIQSPDGQAIVRRHYGALAGQ